MLSIFSGIDLLGMAFEEEGYCVVGFIDTKWGRDVRKLHPPAGVFEGVIGGPPCQAWTRLQFINPNAGKGLEWVVGEYARVCEEAQPAWFLMEEVPYAPMPLVQGYHVFDVLLTDEDVGGLQPRQRRFTFGTRDGRMLYLPRHERNGNGHQVSVMADARAVPVKMLSGGKEKRSITSAGGGAHGGGRSDGFKGGRLPGGSVALAGHSPVGRRDTPRGEEGHYKINLGDMCEAMGVPRDFTDGMPFTRHGKQAVLGNGVPLAMGRAVARAVREATS